MIAVIFEVVPAIGKMDEYLDLASKLRPELDKIDGFISIERFSSISDPKKILSLSFWKNEEAVTQWRNIEMHRQAQAKGRETIFNDYRIRIGIIERDYSMSDSLETPNDSKVFHKK